MSDKLVTYSAPPIRLTSIDSRKEAVVAALEIVRAAVISTGQPNTHMKKVSEYADTIQAALKSRQGDSL